MRKLFRKKRRTSFVEPDEIFLDSKNLPEFDTQQFEGRIETSIKKQNVYALAGLFLVFLCVAAVKAGGLQLVNGQKLADAASRNSLGEDIIFTERGVIYDRNETFLAWNEASTDSENPFPKRRYVTKPGFSHVLGYVNYPAKDKSGLYWRKNYIGRDGVERMYDEELQGINGRVITERDALGHELSTNMVNPAIPGENLKLSIDARIQEQLHTQIATLAQSMGYVGGGGVMMDVHTGEIVALTSYPEYGSNAMSDGDSEALARYNTDTKKPFLNRVVSGLYTPGSIVKPYVGIAALTEGVISSEKQLLSRKSIVIPNPYSPENPSVFVDYRPDNGWVDIRHALSVSSNIYFYQVAGGFQDQRGIGIAKLEKYIRLFGIGSKTGIDLPGEVDGIVPSPEWKKKNFKGEAWRLGDTYHTAIGQYGFQVTPIQMVRAVSAIANGGNLVTPHLVLGAKIDKPTSLGIPEETIRIAREGMRMAVTEPRGTGIRLKSLNTAVAVKSGTAEVGKNNEYVNSWTTSFFPYESPRYALVVVMERAPGKPTGAIATVHGTLMWMEANTPEYLNSTQ